MTLQQKSSIHKNSNMLQHKITAEFLSVYQDAFCDDCKPAATLLPHAYHLITSLITTPLLLSPYHFFSYHLITSSLITFSFLYPWALSSNRRQGASQCHKIEYSHQTEPNQKIQLDHQCWLRRSAAAKIPN